jgi:DNA primase
LGRIPDHVIDEIARGTDIVRLVGQYVNLKRKGTRHWGLCPFHEEKTPSFCVSEDKGLYKCFGCGEGGSVFTFLMKMENVSFIESVHTLAERCGVDLSAWQGGDAGERDEIARLRELHEFAAEFFSRALRSEAGRKALSYVERRRIGPESIESWRLGYAPGDWHAFERAARKRGFPVELLISSGLVGRSERSGDLYDRFRDRLIFPILDRSGRVIAFGGRQLEDEEGPKYLNSPESMLFSKGRNLYGICEAKEAVRGRREAVVVEGYMDVIMCHQSGLDWVVGVLGTALTEHHARELRRLCESVVLVFDADEAGQRAAGRSIEVLLAEDLEIRVARLPGDMDPYDLLVERGREAMASALEGAVDFFDYRLQSALGRADRGTVHGRRQVFAEVVPLALATKDPARRDMLVRSIARELGIGAATVWGYLEKADSEQRRRDRRRAPAEAAPAAPAEKPAAWQRTLREMLGMVMSEPSLSDAEELTRVLETIPACPERELLSSWAGYVEEVEEGADGRLFVHRFEDGPLGRLAVGILSEEEARSGRINLEAGERWRGAVAHLGRQLRRVHVRGLARKLSAAEGAEAERELLRRISQSRQEN